MTNVSGLPVSGYQPQSPENIKLVNENKATEEILLRQLDLMGKREGIDGRWLAIGRTHIEQGFMAINRAVFKPQRVALDSDVKEPAPKAEPVDAMKR